MSSGLLGSLLSPKQLKSTVKTQKYIQEMRNVKIFKCILLKKKKKTNNTDSSFLDAVTVSENLSIYKGGEMSSDQLLLRMGPLAEVNAQRHWQSSVEKLC